MREQLLALGVAHALDVRAPASGVVTEAPCDEVLEAGALAVDSLDARGVELVDDEAQTWPGLDGLELVEVADAQHLGAGAFGHIEHGSHLAHREHPGLVDHDHGGGVESDPALAYISEEARQAVGLDVALGAEVDRGAPRQGSRDDAVATFPVEVGHGTKRDGFA